MNLNRPTALGTAVAIALFAGNDPAMAQQSQPQADIGTAQPIEEIVVTGIRRSLSNALYTKRNSSTVVDAVSAEGIGKFPDKNIAESLSRLPGVTISRDFGEGQGVTIRGLAPGFNITLVNGQAIGTAQWFVLSEAQRNFNFEMLSSEMVAGIEVHKSARADIDEGALGGTVNLRTRRPLDLAAGTLEASVDAQYSDLSEEWDPSGSVLYSWKNDANSFGVLVGLSHQNRTVRRETTETFGFFGPADTRLEPNFNAPTGASEAGILPWGVGSALFQQDRERNGVDLNLQWAPSDAFVGGLHYFFSELKADNQNQNFIAIPFRGLFASDPVSSGSVDNGVVTDLAVDGGDPAVWANHVAFDSIYRDGSSMETQLVDLEGTYYGENWSLHGQIGTTTGDGVNRDEFFEFFAFSQDPRVNFDFTNPGGTSPSISYERSPWILNPTDEMLLTGVFDQRNTLEDTEDYIQADLAFDVELGFVNELKFGAKYRDREFTQNRVADRLANTVVGDVAQSLGTAGQYASGTLTVDHDETSLQSTTTFDVDRLAMRNAFLAAPDCSAAAPGAVCVNRDLFDAAASFNIQEEIAALYAMASFQSESVRGNVGVRYVETDTTSNAFDLAAPELTPTSSSGDYGVWLPSVNLVWDLSEDLLLRFAAGKAISRPAPFQLTSAVNLTPETSSGTSGNPDLDPLMANQYDLAFEWYFDSESLLGATFFLKDIKDFVFDSVSAETIEGVFIARLSRPQNGPSAELRGVELIAQHRFANNFGFVANYTYTDIDASPVPEAALVDGEATIIERTVQFPFTSEHSFNLTGYYETERLGARLSYSYRDEFFKATNETGQLWGDEQQTLDAQFAYNVTDSIALRLEALNIAGQTIDDFYRSVDGQDLTASQFYNGRRFYVGVNYSFE